MAIQNFLAHVQHVATGRIVCDREGSEADEKIRVARCVLRGTTHTEGLM